MALSRNEKAILKTLSYGDIFHFPLTKEELWRYLISPLPLSRKSFEHALMGVSAYICSKDGYFCLKGREAIIDIRQENAKYIDKKMRLARFAASYISYIPTVLFIGVSGSLGVGNVRREDDIDFFVVTKEGTIFTTRLLVSLILETLGLRRRKDDKNPTNKICVNLYIDEKNLHWSRVNQDIYFAHEIIQLRGIFDREETYRKFLAANKWVQRFLPNALVGKEDVENVFGRRDYIVLNILSLFINFYPFRAIIGWAQRLVMQKSRTVEIVQEHMLAFHPNDYRVNILHELGMKEGKLRSLTKD